VPYISDLFEVTVQADIPHLPRTIGAGNFRPQTESTRQPEQRAQSLTKQTSTLEPALRPMTQ